MGDSKYRGEIGNAMLNDANREGLSDKIISEQSPGMIEAGPHGYLGRVIYVKGTANAKALR